MVLLENIVYEKGKYWVHKVENGYEVYVIGATCSTRRVQIGMKGDKGLEEAKMWCERLEKQKIIS